MSLLASRLYADAQNRFHTFRPDQNGPNAALAAVWDDLIQAICEAVVTEFTGNAEVIASGGFISAASGSPVTGQEGIT